MHWNAYLHSWLKPAFPSESFYSRFILSVSSSHHWSSRTFTVCSSANQKNLHSGNHTKRQFKAFFEIWCIYLFFTTRTFLDNLNWINAEVTKQKLKLSEIVYLQNFWGKNVDWKYNILVYFETVLSDNCTLDARCSLDDDNYIKKHQKQNFSTNGDGKDV